MSGHPAVASKRDFVLASLTALAAVAMSVLVPLPAQAETSPSGTAIYATRDLNVYAKAGETIEWRFEKVRGNTAVAIRFDGPGVDEDKSCGLVFLGEVCDDSWVAKESGVHRFQYDTGGNLNATTRSSSWDIQVFDGDTPVPGRVWTEEYEMTNLSPSELVDFQFWYLGQFGDLYRVAYTDFNGVNSTFLASAVGLVNPNGAACVPQYRSSQRGDEPNQLNPADPSAPLRPLMTGECGGRYKIFFAEPDATMPATATWWNGTTNWLYPPVTDPVISNLDFTIEEAGSLAGTVTFDVENFQGTLEIEIDANGDGDMNDAVDRVVPHFVSALAPPAQSYHFDGLDGMGEPIPADQEIVITVSIDRTGEVHFVNTDAEVRRGLQIESLRGPEAGNTLLYWDDTVFAGVSTEKCSTTPILDGSAGIDTASEIRHGWEPCDDGPVTDPPTNANNGYEGSWGDARHIHDWSFRSVEVVEAISVVGILLPPDPTDPESPLPPTGADTAPALAAGALLLGGLLLIGYRQLRRTAAAGATRR